MNSFMKSSWQAFPVAICFWQQYSDGVLLLYVLFEISIAQCFVTFAWHPSKWWELNIFFFISVNCKPSCNDKCIDKKSHSFKHMFFVKTNNVVYYNIFFYINKEKLLDVNKIKSCKSNLYVRKQFKTFYWFDSID